MQIRQTHKLSKQSKKKTKKQAIANKTETHFCTQSHVQEKQAIANKTRHTQYHARNLTNKKKKTKQNLKISPTHILIQDTTCTSIRPTGPATSIRQSPLEVCVSSSSDERGEEVKPGEEEP